MLYGENRVIHYKDKQMLNKLGLATWSLEKTVFTAEQAKTKSQTSQ